MDNHFRDHNYSVTSHSTDWVLNGRNRRAVATSSPALQPSPTYHGPRGGPPGPAGHVTTCDPDPAPSPLASPVRLLATTPARFFHRPASFFLRPPGRGCLFVPSAHGRPWSNTQSSRPILFPPWFVLVLFFVFINWSGLWHVSLFFVLCAAEGYKPPS